MNVKNYILAKGWEFKTVKSENGNEINVKVCPFCHDSNWHFYISEDTGMFICHKANCGAKGSFLTLKKHLNDVGEIKPLIPENNNFNGFSEEEVNKILNYHINLCNDPIALKYLHDRKISNEAIKFFKLGVTHENGTKFLVIPFFKNNRLMNVKLRSLPPSPKTFKRWVGGKSILFNEDALNYYSDSIIITEGETDCISLWSHGYRNVIGVSVGAGSIKPEWIQSLDRVSKIFIVFDQDIAGQTGAKKLANRLGLERCYNVVLPSNINDVNDFFVAGFSKEDFDSLLKQASKFEVENVQSIGSIIKAQLIQSQFNHEDNILKLPWDNVNRLLDGFRPGDLVTLGGRPGVGKSSFSFNLMYYFAKNGIPCLLVSLEMPPYRIVPRFVALHFERDSKECWESDILMQAYESMKEFPLYLAYKYEKPNWNFVADTIRMSVKYYGIRFVVFDNLHFLCRSLNKQTEEVSIMIQNFKLLAEELGITIMVIARPRKTYSKIINEEDLKDSADIAGDSDTIIIIHRDKKSCMAGDDMEGVYDVKTMIYVVKSRYSRGGVTFLLAEDAKCKFKSLGE